MPENWKRRIMHTRKIFQTFFFSMFFMVVIVFLVPSPSPGEEGEPIQSSIFNRDHLNVFTVLILFSILFIFFLFLARKGRTLYLRRLPGIAAIEEAVGRATEMGRPVLFVPGIDNIDEIQTLAGIAVLSHVSKIVARFDSSIIVPTRNAIVLSVCEETVKESFTAAGRPDAYKSDNIRYLSDDQFAFTAAVDGIMLREKPATNIYMGSFYAEALILSETGFSTGAIQVAGTASIAQLPFFVAACDYTLLAEEFYAASAYLSRDPKALSSIKASDYFKIIIIAVIILGIILANLAPEAVGILENIF